MAVRRLNHAVLYVHGLQRTVDFYRAALGFEVRLEIPGRAAFLRAPGSANDHDLGLFEIGTGRAPDQPEHPGLYHLAWEVGTLADLADTREKLVQAGALVGESDHRVSKSLYAKDPSGIEFEVLWRVPVEDWAAEQALDGGYTVPLDWDRTLSRWDQHTQTGAAANSPISEASSSVRSSMEKVRARSISAKRPSGSTEASRRPSSTSKNSSSADQATSAGFVNVGSLAAASTVTDCTIDAVNRRRSSATWRN